MARFGKSRSEQYTCKPIFFINKNTSIYIYIYIYIYTHIYIYVYLDI